MRARREKRCHLTIAGTLGAVVTFFCRWTICSYDEEDTRRKDDGGRENDGGMDGNTGSSSGMPPPQTKEYVLR